MEFSRRIVFIILLCVDAFLLFWGLFVYKPDIGATVYEQSSARTASVGFRKYVNPQFGFSVDAPGNFEATTTFDTFYHVPNTWRYGISDTAPGQPVMNIIVANITNKPGEDQYYFDAEVRIGVSGETEQVANCFVSDDSAADTGMEVINGVAFHTYDLQSAGMSQYALVKSYRTVKNDKCYVFESVITGGGTGNIPQDVSHSQDLITQSKVATENVIKTVVFQ